MSGIQVHAHATTQPFVIASFPGPTPSFPQYRTLTQYNITKWKE